MKITPLIVFLVCLIAVTCAVTCRVFGSAFAEITIDYFAFFAGIFLVSEGLYRMISSKGASFLDQLLRAFRVIIGTCVFTIHLLQFMRY